MQPGRGMRLVEGRRSRMSKLTAVIVVVSVALGVSPARARPIEHPNAIDHPRARGDQVVCYYDARENFTTFVNVRNEGLADLTVRVLFYGPTFSTPFTQTLTLPAGSLQVIDVGGLKASGLPAQFGVAIATAVNGSGEAIVSDSLAGNFTVANLQTSSAWGAAAAARTAVSAMVPFLSVASGTGPAPIAGSALSTLAFGTVIDGVSVLLEPIQPLNADLAVYYNPDSLASPSLGGNQLIFINFEDVADSTYAAHAATTVWSVDATRSNGTSIAPTSAFTAGGVTVGAIATVVGADVSGSSGSISFNALATSAAVTRLVYFTESLGTFGTGYLLPPGFPSLL